MASDAEIAAFRARKVALITGISGQVRVLKCFLLTFTDVFLQFLSYCSTFFIPTNY